MDDATFIYRNRSDDRFYDASTQRMHGGPDKVIVYINGVLCAMDHDAKIIIPVSRWKLAEIGLACFLAAIKGKVWPLVGLRRSAFLNHRRTHFLNRLRKPTTRRVLKTNGSA
jgi:type IV secretory pathway TrbD component